MLERGVKEASNCIFKQRWGPGTSPQRSAGTDGASWVGGETSSWNAESICHASPPGTFLNCAATVSLRLVERADACTNGVINFDLSPPSQWIGCGQCVGCHNTVNCGQCANCKHGTQSPESRKRLCRKRKCICPVRKVGRRIPNHHVRNARPAA